MLQFFSNHLINMDLSCLLYKTETKKSLSPRHENVRSYERVGALVWWLWRRLMFQRLWVRILALYTGWTFFTYMFVVKFVMFVWKDKNKWKRGRGRPIFFKKTYIAIMGHQSPRHLRSRAAGCIMSNHLIRNCNQLIHLCKIELCQSNLIFGPKGAILESELRAWATANS